MNNDASCTPLSALSAVHVRREVAGKKGEFVGAEERSLSSPRPCRKMEEKRGSYYAAFEPPTKLINIRPKKRPLSQRHVQPSDEGSPKKRIKTKGSPKKRPFGVAPPPPDDVTNEDASLLYDFFATNASKGEGTKGEGRPSGSLSSSHSSPPTSLSSSSPASPQQQQSQQQQQPVSTVSYLDLIQTPPAAPVKKRQTLTPAPLASVSPAPAAAAGPRKGGKGTFLLGGVSGPPRSRINLQGRFADEADSFSLVSSKRKETEEGEEEAVPSWLPSPPLDWSLKTRLTLVAGKPFGFNTTCLKSSEESSGVSAFARCVDIRSGIGKGEDPWNKGSTLDSSLGAQFHECCLYWQYPSLPGMKMFPRDATSFASVLGGSSSGIRMESKVHDAMFLEWTDSFRSAFQLLRTRQCPYFYLCCSQWTALFCAAGVGGLDYLQVYVTPGTKGFRESLNSEGIEFTTPCSNPSDKNKNEERESEYDDAQEPNKWLDEMGISQDVSLSHQTKASPTFTIEEKNRSSLVHIAGTHALTFFKFLKNSKNLVVSSTGPFAGLPPTILCPVAFRGATLKQLKVRETKSAPTTSGDVNYVIDLSGPILPHAVHMLCPVIRKKVSSFRVRMSPHPPTLNLNLHSKFSPSTSPSAFQLQNLSDCGLRRMVLEAFCSPDNVDTIRSQLECKEGLFRWKS